MIAAAWLVAMSRTWLDPTPNCEILSAGRCLAASDSVQALSTARGLHRMRWLRVLEHSHMSGPCPKTLSGLVRPRARAVESPGAQTPLSRRIFTITPP